MSVVSKIKNNLKKFIPSKLRARYGWARRGYGRSRRRR